jgi:predicted protein tyrosine phosphatase
MSVNDIFISDISYIILDEVAIGSLVSKDTYKKFEFVFDLDHTKIGEIKYTKVEYDNDDDNNFYFHFQIGIDTTDTNIAVTTKTIREIVSILRLIVKKTKDQVPVTFLCHCFDGFSRSVAITTAYIVIRYNKSIEDALEMVCSARQIDRQDPMLIFIINILRAELDH